MAHEKYPIIIIANFVWIGFVCGISFLEAWIKFKAPGITLPLGLGIGKLVFGALNKVELVLSATILVSLLISKEPVFNTMNGFFMVSLLVLFLQTFWMLPALSDRAQMIMDGYSVPSSNIHFYYIVGEVVKVLSLFIFGIKLFK